MSHDQVLSINKNVEQTRKGFYCNDKALESEYMRKGILWVTVMIENRGKIKTKKINRANEFNAHEFKITVAYATCYHGPMRKIYLILYYQHYLLS